MPLPADQLEEYYAKARRELEAFNRAFPFGLGRLVRAIERGRIDQSMYKDYTGDGNVCLIGHIIASRPELKTQEAVELAGLDWDDCDGGLDSLAWSVQIGDTHTTNPVLARVREMAQQIILETLLKAEEVNADVQV